MLLSTVFTGDERCDRWRRRPSTKTPTARPIQRFLSGEPVKLISIPTIAASYNDEMNHVDRGDQRRSYLGYDHPIRRGAWQAIAWTFLLDIVLVNSFLLQLHGEPAWERYISQKKWRECLYNASSRPSIRKASQGGLLEPETNLRPWHNISTSEEGKNQTALLTKGFN